MLECFLRDIKQGHLGALHCSPFLVNSILATACPFSDFDEVKTRQGKHSDLMALFVAEAKLHLAKEVEQGAKPLITTVQGLGILYAVKCKMGQDGQGYHYAVQATTMWTELDRSRNKILKAASSAEDEQLLSCVLDYTCWGVFTAATNVFMAWRRPQTLRPPKRAFPASTGITPQPHSLNWIPYMQEGQEQNLRLGEVMKHFAALAVIQRDITDLLFAEQADTRACDPSYLRSLFQLKSRVRSFHDDLLQNIRCCRPMLPSVFQVL